jgi:hypothetical protein
MPEAIRPLAGGIELPVPSPGFGGFVARSAASTTVAIPAGTAGLAAQAVRSKLELVL